MNPWKTNNLSDLENALALALEKSAPITPSSKCPVCESEKIYSTKYDSYFCELCNAWLEKGCADPECEFCSQRPKYPSQII